jgi:hypothetical protein
MRQGLCIVVSSSDCGNLINWFGTAGRDFLDSSKADQHRHFNPRQKPPDKTPAPQMFKPLWHWLSPRTPNHPYDSHVNGDPDKSDQ